MIDKHLLKGLVFSFIDMTEIFSYIQQKSINAYYYVYVYYILFMNLV